MDKPCCVGVVRDAAGLKGSESKLGDLNVYTTAPAKHNGNGVVVVHDIFGFGIPNTKFIVDHLAENGFHATMPDFYGTNPGPWAEDKELSGDEFGAWFGSIMTPEFWERFTANLKLAVDDLKAKGCKKVGVIGFCWGGKASAVAAASGMVEAAVSLHGAAHSVECLQNAKCPIFFISVPGDNYFSEETHQKIRDELPKNPNCDIKIFDSYHGFVVRGDFSDAALKAKADEAMKDTVTFLNKHLA